MKGSTCWVTLAESDAEAWMSLVLARSIRKTLTTRPVVIAISEHVSQSMKVLLQREFDTVLRFETNEVGGKGNGILWLWNLRSWTSCVYLDPHSYMLQNSDELFSKGTFLASWNHDDSPNFFAFEPNLQDVDRFDELRETAKANVTNILKKHFQHDQKCTSECQVASKSIMSLEEFVLSYREFHNPYVINFKNMASKNMLHDYGKNKETNDFVRTWIATFVHEVVPQVNRVISETDKKFLLCSLEEHKLPTINGPATTNSIEFNDLDKMSDAIAVIGMSCRFPGANNEDEFWDVLISSQDPVRKFPLERRRLLKDNEVEEKFEAGFLKCSIDEFDAKFFGISPREAPFVDPQQRLLLEVIWESLENANINPQTLRETNTGVFVGIWQQEYDRDIPDSGLTANEFHHRYLGNAFSATASRISNFLGLYGPNYAIESGCSSSSSAVHLAVQSLRREETPLAIASGVNLVLHVVNPLGGEGAGSVVFSNDFRCKTFDERANGFVRAEGCGAVVLKKLVKAIQDGDEILGIIRGTALNNDGPATSFGTPNANAQEQVVRAALLDAGVKPWNVNLVEAHGTGTIVGDPIETYALGQVYSENRVKPLMLGSVKSNIGHTEACAGMAGLIKVLLCLKYKKVPPQLHFQNLNPRINLESIPAIIPTEVTDWKADKRIAAISSFSMSGTNVHLIVQETPTFLNSKKQLSGKSKSMQMIGISAKSGEALEALCHKYVSYLDENRNVDLSDIAYTLNTGRANMSNRIAIVAKDTEQFITKLEKKTYAFGVASTENPKIFFLFTGQGSQYFGMAKNLSENFPVFQVAFNRCDVLFQKYLKVSLKEVLWTNPSLLDNTIYCQPAIFSIQFCLVQVWDSFGIRPDYVLGHSVGEFCAAVCAGLLNLDDAMKLVVGRSQLVDSLEGGKMLVLKTSAAETRRLIKEFTETSSNCWIDVAAENSMEETVVSGIAENVQNFTNFCSSRGFKTQMISASHAFHSRQMESVLSEFGNLASTITYKKLNCSYISGTLAREMKAEEFDATYWIRHLRDTVRFQEAVKFAWTTTKEGKVFIEIGSQPILLSLAMATITDPSMSTFCPSLRKAEDDVLCLMSSLAKLYVAGVDISWKYWFDKRGKKLRLPTYPFQRQKFWYQDENEKIPVSPLLHPIVGRQLQTPILDHVYTQILSTKHLPYFSDHRVAERVILPAAAYLETIMATGCHVLQGGKVQTPFAVTDFVVEAAMELSQCCHIQTIAHSVGGDEGVKFEIGLYKQISRDELDKWKRHSIASFSPSLHTTTPSILDLNEMQGKMEAIDSIAKVYEASSKAGIQFGPKFQSIARAWRDQKSVLIEVQLPENASSYICHPIVLDAMIQTSALRKALISKDTSEVIQLQLPVGFKKFTWLARNLSEKLYIYTNWTDTDGVSEEGTISLLNDSGETLAIMTGLELIVTTVSNFLRTLNTESNVLPEFMEEIWRPTCGITRNRHDPATFLMKESEFTRVVVADAARVAPDVVTSFDLMGKQFALFILRGVIECQWPWPKVGDKLTVNAWASLAPSALRIVRTPYLLETLANHNYLKKIDEDFQVVQNLPSLEKIEAEIVQGFTTHLTLTKLVDEDNVIHLFTKRCGSYFSGLLHGTVSPISYLFPNEAHEVGAVRFHSEGHGVRESNKLATAVLLDAVRDISPGTSRTLRILEVGAGSGICCRLIIKGLEELNLPVQYTFTDISPIFLNEAKKMFSKGVTFSVLNIEEDPLTQGFAPDHFDFIVAVNVIHATANVAQALQNLRLLLRKNGILIVNELVKDLTFVTLSFGFLDGWWRFSDDRRNSPLLNDRQWKVALEEAGFADIKSVVLPAEIAASIVGRKTEKKIVAEKTKPWIVISDGSHLEAKMIQKMGLSGRTVEIYDDVDALPINLEGLLFMYTEATDDKSDRKCQQLLNLCQKLIIAYQDTNVKPKIFLVTRGVYYVGDSGPGNPNAATITSLIRSFVNEYNEFPVTTVDLDQDEVDIDREVNELFAAIWSNEKEMFKTVREDKVFIQRVISSDKRKLPLSLPNSNRFRIINPPSKSLNDLQILVAPKIEPVGNQVEIAVKATALNFRDLFLILRPEGFDIPAEADMNPGLDIAGVVSAIGPECTKFQVGDSVFGFTPGDGLASHVVVSSDAIIRKPPQMTFTSAATLPVAFFTILYSFRECANLQAGDRVLIHVATGGVGLAAIQYAKNVGAEIYATAGSRRKRTYLRSIGINHVYHSRNTAFGDEILRDTGDKGVNVVLNSLTGPNFKEASLKACAPEARFVEIGKINIWTEEDVKVLRPDVKYFIVELSITARKEPERIVKLAEAFAGEIDQGVFNGLPHETFPLDMIREAFFYFQEAKHIGKIVVRIPESKVSSQGKICFQQPLFHMESTYLITGGLGGIGMEVAKWMVTMGAENIVLVGRSPPNVKCQEIINNMNEGGCRVVAMQADVGIFQECNSLLMFIHNNFPPLRGIMHAAGVIADGIIANQNWENFEAVFQPKVYGTWNLHQLTLGLDLEFFTVFSSIVALLGTPGQSNHAAANRFMDSFVHYRNSLGLPANSVNYGPWSDVGAAAKLKLVQDFILGVRFFSPTQGVLSLEKIFRTRSRQTVVADVSDWNLLKQVIRLGHYLDEMKSEQANNANSVEEFKVLVEQIKNALPEKRQEMLENFLEKAIKETLRIPENEQLDRDQNFSEIGVDSLMAMELRNRLQGILGENKQLTVSALQENRKIRTLAAHLTSLMNSDCSVVPLETLIAQDSILPPEIQPVTTNHPVQPSQFKEILLTGATGHLGVNFLPAIQRQNPNLVIHCLVRGANSNEASQRLQKTIELYSLCAKVNLDKIRIVVGDMSKENFDLPLESYETLATSVDAIVHCAVKSNHLEEYNALGDGSLRTMNVLATVNLLRFAATGHTKRFLYASSLLAVTKATESGAFVEDFPTDNEDGVNIKNGYSLSKFICERLMTQAIERGIPVTTIRYASIAGNSETGFMPTGNNHAWRILLSCIRVRAFPDFGQDGIPWMAVDTAADISAQIFLQDTMETGMYNLTSSSVISEDDMKASFSKFGIDGKFLPFSKWRDLVFEEFDKNDLAPFLTLYGEDDSTKTQNYIRMHPLAGRIFSCKINSISDKVTRNCPDFEDQVIPAKLLLERHLQFYFDSLTP